jgi:uncharacterized SAM-binding protein YcdF (DUF218 family)
MGAAVLVDGAPSGAMQRRVEGALALAAGEANSLFMPTGGVGRYGEAEAEVMARLLTAQGVAADRILTETASSDTLSSVAQCSALIRTRADISRVVVCTDRYHAWRCAVLFRLMGVPASIGRVASGRRANGWPTWLYYHLREALALPWDIALALLRRV